MRIWQASLVATTIILAGMVAGSIYIVKSNHLQFYTVTNNDMAPNLLLGDLFVGQQVRAEQWAVGDVISYGAGETVNTARVRSIDQKTGTVYVTADNVDAAPWGVRTTEITSTYKFSVPLAGYLLQEFRRPEVLIGLIYIPAILILAREVRRLARSYGHKPYNLSNS